MEGSRCKANSGPIAHHRQLLASLRPQTLVDDSDRQGLQSEGEIKPLLAWLTAHSPAYVLDSIRTIRAELTNP
jgi:hypothetical protein